jgi:hypothetical protein
MAVAAGPPSADHLLVADIAQSAMVLNGDIYCEKINDDNGELHEYTHAAITPTAGAGAMITRNSMESEQPAYGLHASLSVDVKTHDSGGRRLDLLRRS